MRLPSRTVLLIISTFAFIAQSITASKPFVIRRPVARDELASDVSKSLTIDQMIRQVMEKHSTSPQDMPNNLAMMMSDDPNKILAEMDMVLSKEQYSKLYGSPPLSDFPKSSYSSRKPTGGSPGRRHHGSKINKSRRKKRKVYQPITPWENKEVPYVLNPWDFSGNERAVIKLAMEEWEHHTCIQFRPSNTSDTHKLVFQNGVGCNSQLGQVGGSQSLNLEAPGCRFKGLYLHEIGHALGMVHEHQLPDRDNHIQIIWDNVKPDWKEWFNKYDAGQFYPDMDIPYDLESVMHYGIYAFSKDDVSQTIQANNQDMENRIGRVFKKELSFYDIKVVNSLYKCGEHCPSKVKCNSEGYVGKDCTCICKDGSSNCQRYPPLPVAPPPMCENKHASDMDCRKWAGDDECSLNPLWMIENCQKTCSKCHRTPNPPLPPKICANIETDSECDTFARAGECTANPAWMLHYCKASCGWCIRDTSTDCRDLYPDSRQCEEWKRYGQCDRNPAWMWANCRRTCDVCYDTGVLAGCSNKAGDEKCHADASVGDCKDNPEDMNENCKKACGKCGSCFNELVDDSVCIDLTNEGECTNSPEWMGRYCRKSCDACEAGLPIGEARPCTDKDQRCEGWAREGECEANPSWMIANCQRSCNRCNCVNLHNADQCHSWANRGECESNPEWMANNCQKSCLLCTNLPPPPDRCSNVYTDDSKCRQWALEGECFSNPLFMIPQCRKACTKCDTYVECETWSAWSAWTGCTRTCGMGMRARTRTCRNAPGSEDEMKGCSEGDCPTTQAPSTVWTTVFSLRTSDRPIVTEKPTAPTTIDPDCTNSYPRDNDCELWAKHSHCNSNPIWMKTNCAKSCGVCKGSCKNNYGDDDQCTGWAEAGQCESNPGWMLPNCAKACNQCGGRTTVSTIVTTTPTVLMTLPVSCENIHSSDSDCEIWAQNGHCDINPGYMLKNCGKACGCLEETTPEILSTPELTTVASTTTAPAGCVDKHASCTSWAQSHHEFCSTSVFVAENCRRSCKKCDTGLTFEHIGDPNCRDKLTTCAQLARQGKCSIDRHYMKNNCRLSCEWCQPQLCINTDLSCDRWAAAQACHIFPNLMAKKCRLACGYCNDPLYATQPRQLET